MASIFETINDDPAKGPKVEAEDTGQDLFIVGGRRPHRQSRPSRNPGSHDLGIAGPRVDREQPGRPPQD